MITDFIFNLGSELLTTVVVLLLGAHNTPPLAAGMKGFHNDAAEAASNPTKQPWFHSPRNTPRLAAGMANGLLYYGVCPGRDMHCGGRLA